MLINGSEKQYDVMRKACRIISDISWLNFDSYTDALFELNDSISNKDECYQLIRKSNEFAIESASNPEANVGLLVARSRGVLLKLEVGEYDFSDDEMRTIRVACENYARIGMKQTDHMRDILIHSTETWTVRDFCTIVEGFDKLGKLIQGDNGIYGSHADSRMAWDINQVTRHHLAWKKNPKGDIFVDFDKPMKTGDESLISIDRT
jgi:hypothetical protein